MKNPITVVPVVPEEVSQPTVQEIQPPADFGQALALVRKLQIELDNMPASTRSGQRARWVKLQQLERAKAHMFRLQQLPDSPPGAYHMASLQPVTAHQIKTLRERLLEEIRSEKK
jgi:hypothetical protein